MPPEGNPEEIDSILAQATTEDAEAQPFEKVFGEDQGHAELLAPTPRESQEKHKETLLAGKYKSPEELVKAYGSLQKVYGQRTARVKQLEALLGNPRFQAAAQADPELADTLAKLGYELRKADDRAEMSGAPTVPDEIVSDLTSYFGRKPTRDEVNDYRMLLMEEHQELRWQLLEFGQERGKPLSQEESRAIRDMLAISPNLTVQQAYRLTPLYEKSLKEKEDARVADATKKFAPSRPKPPPTLLPGQKLDLKRPVIEQNDAERKATIAEIIEKNP